jgi:putative endonuclease
MSQDRIALGKSGEDLACRELQRLGYAIVERRVRSHGGEIDIVARDGETLVFVEVKARETAGFGSPAEAVTPWKQRRIARLAQDYVTRHEVRNRPLRFDVVAIQFDAGPIIEVFQNAFEAP